MIGEIPNYVWGLVAGAALLAVSWALLVCGAPLTRAWRAATGPGRAAFFVAALVAVLVAGTKPPAPPPLGLGWDEPPYFQPAEFPTVTADDIARGWQCMRVVTNEPFAYALPDGMTPCHKWWVHGAYEDVVRVGLGDGFWFPFGETLCTSVWAHAWGRVRPRLQDATNELAAVDGRLSAVPSVSRFWSAPTTNDAVLLTWENFAADRSSLLSSQLELKRNGDFVARSNDVAWLCRHISPTDWDGDGWRNEDDPHPYQWDLFENEFAQTFDTNANRSCYYWIDIRTDVSGRIAFVGDGPSDLPDPDFEARAGQTYRVELLIGKEYAVRAAGPLSVLDCSSSDVEIHRHGVTRFNVIWPVTIDVLSNDPPLLRRVPSPAAGPLMTALPRQNGFFLSITPDWLGGTVDWSTNTCCQVIDDGGGYSFQCATDCGCGGCSIAGTYTYEGYVIRFVGAACGCSQHDPEEESATAVGLSVPTVVFKDGALRPLSVDIERGDEGCVGTLTLVREGAQSKIRIWADRYKRVAASQFAWDVSGFDGCTYWIEGVEASAAADDISFRLVWEREDRDDVEIDDTTTCAELQQTFVTSTLPNRSPNPPPFEANTRYSFDLTHSPSTDRHWSTHYRDAVDANMNVRDFDVDMTLAVSPNDAPVGLASWFPIGTWPASGSLVHKGPRVGAVRNPKEAGVFHVGACFDGSPTNECIIVLPLAGAAMDDVLLGDLARVRAFATAARAKYEPREINSAEFGAKWFVEGGNGDYLGRPDNAGDPCVWYYSQVNDATGMGGIGTLGGLPIRVAKLSNLLAAYACEKLGVSRFRQLLSQFIGSWNDFGAWLSWQAGQDLAAGADFDETVRDLATRNWKLGDERTGRPWPNASPVTNHSPSPFYTNFNIFFYSPGMLGKEP